MSQARNFLSSKTLSIMADNASQNDRATAQFLQNFAHNNGGDDSISRATTPGLGFSANSTSGVREKSNRNRTFPYFQLLPYKVEEENERNDVLIKILKNLYTAIKAEDIIPGALHWTKELRSWMSLKFELTRELRANLVKLYYMLTLAPGMDKTAADKFESMFRFLLK